MNLERPTVSMQRGERVISSPAEANYTQKTDAIQKVVSALIEYPKDIPLGVLKGLSEAASTREEMSRRQGNKQSEAFGVSVDKLERVKNILADDALFSGVDPDNIIDDPEVALFDQRIQQLRQGDEKRVKERQVVYPPQKYNHEDLELDEKIDASYREDTKVLREVTEEMSKSHSLDVLPDNVERLRKKLSEREERIIEQDVKNEERKARQVNLELPLATLEKAQEAYTEYLMQSDPENNDPLVADESLVFLNQQRMKALHGAEYVENLLAKGGPERNGEVQRFSAETREKLERAGYHIYELSGQSIRTLKAAGNNFTSKSSTEPVVEKRSSRLSEVAINPATLFLPDSKDKSLHKQEELVNDFSQTLREKLKVDDVEAVIGEAPDYIELALVYFELTGERLFGMKNGYDYARTKTPTTDSYVAIVGRFKDNLDVNGWFSGGGSKNVHAAPLIVPSE